MNDLTPARSPSTLQPCEPAGEAAHLVGRVQPVATLGDAERSRMYELLAAYFANGTRRQFERDLAEKEWAILLADSESGQIQGFSTLMRLHACIDQQPVVAFFSGDTIIRREYWGETVLPRLWAQHVFGLAGAIQQAQVYWFLISSGYKTYRFLPVFFREFYPSCLRPTPPLAKKLLDTLGHLKFGAQYRQPSGIVRLAQATPLRAGVADITRRRLKDPHVAFFAAANPGHEAGDELACLVEITPANLTPAGQRMVGDLAHVRPGGWQ